VIKGHPKRRFEIKIFIFIAILVTSFTRSDIIYSNLCKASGEQVEINKINTNTYENIVKPNVVYSYEMMMEDALKLSNIYPDLIRISSIGKSVEGRDILFISLGKGAEKILLNGSHHAREYITTTFLMKMIEDYAYSYRNNLKPGGYDVKSILKEVTILVIPMVNPDGVNLVQKGLNFVKRPDMIKKMNLLNTRYGYKSWKTNINGVDLNRNYPTGWEERKTTVKSPSSEQYKGKSAASEPEVKAMIAFVEENKDISIYASYHTQGEVIYWADHKNIVRKEERALAKKLAALTGYALIPAEESLGDYGGGFSEWTRNFFRKPSYTIELCPYVGSYPYPDKKFDRVWKTARCTGLIMAEEALKSGK
jgi:hypothetical protein